MKKLIFIALLTAPQILFASNECAFTQEYYIARYETRKTLNEPLNLCRDSAHEAIYWKSMAKCHSEGKGKNVGGGCGHLVSNGGFGFSNENVDVSHCDVFRWKKSDITDHLKHLIKIGKLIKCKT